MDALRDAFHQMDLTNAQTLIASGNVLFDSEPDTELPQKLERGLKNIFDLRIECMVRTLAQVQEMCEHAPLNREKVSDDTKFYVYFLAEPLTHPIEVPFGKSGDFDIIGQTEYEIYAKAYRMKNGRFGAGLDKFAKTLGVINTNRNWNTILRIADKATS